MNTTEELRNLLKKTIRQAIEHMSKEQIAEKIFKIEDEKAKLLALITTLNLKGENKNDN